MGPKNCTIRGPPVTPFNSEINQFQDVDMVQKGVCNPKILSGLGVGEMILKKITSEKMDIRSCRQT